MRMIIIVLIFMMAMTFAYLLITVVVGSQTTRSPARSPRPETRKKSRNTKRDVKEAARELWRDGEKYLRDFEIDYTRVMCDPETVLSTPLIDDLTCKPTKHVYDQWEKVKELQSMRRVQNLNNAQDFYNAARKLTEVWKYALSEAQRIGLSVLNENDRKDINTAKNLLSLAYNESASLPERVSAIEKAKEILDRLNIMQHRMGSHVKSPLETIEASLSSAQRKAIESP